MGMVVRTNTMSTNAYRQLGMNNASVAKSLEKLSSGFRINRAGDDASGLAISEKMKSQIKGLEQAAANAQDGISLVQTAEGALTEVHSMLNRMVELATKSANGTIQNEVDRESIQTEVDALKGEITRIAKSTNFNGIQLLDGSLGGGTPAVKATAAGEALSGKGTAAVKFSATYDMDSDTTLQLKFNDVDGNSVTITSGTVTGGAAQAALDDMKANHAEDYAKLTAAYDVKVDGANITFTAKAAGVNGKVQAHATTAADITGKTDGANAKTDITLSEDMEAGDTFSVGGKTYTMVAAGTADATKGTFENYAGLKALVDASGDYTLTGGTALADGETLTVTANKTGQGLTLQVGPTNDDFNKVTVQVDDLSAEGLHIEDLDVSSAEAAGKAIQTINDAINQVSTNRGNLGALQNRLEYAINNLDTTSENMNAANSRIRDTDMAKEMMNYTKMNILTQAAQAMLAQANQQPQSILQLLQ